MLRLYTLGGLRIDRGGQLLQLPTPKACDLLAYLVTFRQRSHPRAVLAGTLWPDLPEDKARRRLSDTLWRVRRAVGDHVTAEDEYIGFDTSLPYWLDVEHFQGLEPEISDLQSLETALSLYRGPYLEGLYHDWVLLERERLRNLCLEMQNHLLTRHKRHGDYEAALQVARGLVAVEPLHEIAHRELMRLCHLLGRDAEAIAQYQRCREILQAELGVTPSPETEALYHSLARRTPDGSDASSIHLPVPASRVVFHLDEPPLVGRDTERAALLRHLEAAASGQGGIVLLEGEAGIGKTRLAHELVAGARWRNIDAAIAVADESSASPSYALLIDALTPALSPLRIRQLAHLMEDDHLSAVAALFPQIAKTLPDQLPLSELPPPQARERLQDALKALILELARIAPRLWVLDDLQWADAETLSFLPRLLPRLSSSRTLCVVIGRSAELRVNPAAWNALQALDQTGSLSRYSLSHLDASAVGLLVRNLLGDEHPVLTEQLAQESEGVPLYLVETLKTWRDEGHLVSDEQQGWHWQGDIPVSIAYTGEAVIEHRLAQLSSAAEQVLGVAAIIGIEVDFDLLLRICTSSAPDSDALDRYLLTSDELLRLGFLAETESGYRFSHECVRRAIYHQLPSSRQRQLHCQVAEAAESLFPDRLELLAHHFRAGGERDRAIHYLTRATESARQLFAHQAALSSFESLLELLDRSDDRTLRYDALQDRAQVLGWIGDREAQGRDLEEVFSLAREIDETHLARALRQRSAWHQLQGHYALAEEDALAALEIYRRIGDDRAQASLLDQKGWNIVYTANYPQALSCFQEAFSIYEGLGDIDGQLHCLEGLITIAEADGDYALAFSYGQQCMALAKASGSPNHMALALFNLGVKYHDLGDAAAAETHLLQVLRLDEETGDRRHQAATYLFLGEAAIERDGYQDAQAYLDAALAIFREVKDSAWEGDVVSAMGRLALLQGDATAAKKHLQVAYQGRCARGEPAYGVVDLAYLALAELALGNEADAWQHSLGAVAELDAGLTGVERPQRVYYNHYLVAEATHHWAVARVALEEAGCILEESAQRIDDPVLREQFRTGQRVRRDIIAALAAQPPPGRLLVRLARADVPGQRPPTPEETVTLTWTADAGEADAALAKQEGKASLRRHRLLRLLSEAEAAGVLPTFADLAGALDVSDRTIRSDLAALRRQGHTVRTRGRRS